MRLHVQQISEQVTVPPDDNARSGDREFAERVPEYLRPGYRALMAGDADSAIESWESLYNRYPSAEVCGHISRAHYYRIFFLGHLNDVARLAEHVEQIRLWAERALSLNPNSSIGHAMLSVAIGQEAQISGSQRQIILSAWDVRHHAEQAILIDNNWIGHYLLGVWHRELSSINPGFRAITQLLHGRLPRASYSKSIEHFQEVLKQYPENNFIYAEMAYTYERMGDMDNACRMYRQCITMPLFRHPIAGYHTAMVIERLGRKCKGQ
jgi:tetratricopeptide (TPR) repeat protein